MRIAWKWLFVGLLVTFGGLWFAMRAAMALNANVEISAYVIGAFAIGAFAAGAMIGRHGLVKPWREPLISAGVAIALFVVLGYLDDDTNNWSGPLSGTTSIENILAVVAVLSATAGGAWVGRRFSARPPTVASLFLLGGLVTIGCVMACAGILVVSGADIESFSVALILVVPAIAGFITQAAISVRRPWACGGGAFMLLLLMLQEDGLREIIPMIIGVGLVMLIDVAGAGIAVAVFRARFTAPLIDMPEAQAR